MQILIQLLLLVVGFALLMKGADWFVEGASKIADKLGIPQLVIGLTIVAMGTSLPEAAVSITSALKGSAEITIGNIVGSNIFNVLVILGLTAVICAIPVQKSTVRYEIPFTIAVTAVLAVLGLVDNKISRGEGVILWGLMIVYLLYLLKLAKNGQPLEVFLGHLIQNKFIRPKVRIYQTNNLYSALVRQSQLEQEVKRIARKGRKTGKA